MTIKTEINILLNHKIQCVDFGMHLSESENSLKCISCNRLYTINAAGVWDFCESINDGNALEIYKEANYQKWKEVFEKRFYGLGSAMSILYLYITIVICWLLYSVMVSRGKNED